MFSLSPLFQSLLLTLNRLRLAKKPMQSARHDAILIYLALGAVAAAKCTLCALPFSPLSFTHSS